MTKHVDKMIETLYIHLLCNLLKAYHTYNTREAQLVREQYQIIKRSTQFLALKE